MKTGTDTKTQILDTAEQLVRERGFNGFSYKDVSKPLGIRNAAVHYHYASKGDLGIALIRRYRTLLADSTREFMNRGGSAALQLEALIHRYNCACKANMVCPMSMVATDYYTISEGMRTEGSKLMSELIEWMERVLETGRAQGEFDFPGNSRGKAVEILAALQGATQMARLVGADAYDTAVTQIRRDLNSGGGE